MGFLLFCFSYDYIEINDRKHFFFKNCSKVPRHLTRKRRLIGSARDFRLAVTSFRKLKNASFKSYGCSSVLSGTQKILRFLTQSLHVIIRLSDVVPVLQY